jgi:hypothetical protein
VAWGCRWTWDYTGVFRETCYCEDRDGCNAASSMSFTFISTLLTCLVAVYNTVRWLWSSMRLNASHFHSAIVSWKKNWWPAATETFAAFISHLVSVWRKVCIKKEDNIYILSQIFLTVFISSTRYKGVVIIKLIFTACECDSLFF